MKKTISSFLAIILLFACILGNAFADEFSIHSNVKFGMSKDEVIKLESEAGFPVTSDEFSDLHTCSHGKNYISLSGTVAGVKDASIFYHFDSEDKLESAIYLLGYSSRINGTRNSFDSINQLLSEKYGVGNTSALSAIENGQLDFCVRHFGGTSSVHTLSCSFSDAYVVPLEDEKTVVIYICSLNQILITGATLGELLFVEYHVFDNEEYNKVTNSISNDL